MLDLVVKCEKAREGCEWEGEIRSLDQHKSTCLHVPVPCPQECDVGSVLRGDLQSHLRDYCSQRDYKCPHCLQMGRYRERVTSHLQHCPMEPTECPNEGCEEIVPRSLVQAHLDEDCEYTILPCSYIGCEMELPRWDLQEHEDDLRFHLKKFAWSSRKKTRAMRTNVQQLTATCASLQSDVKKLTHANTSLQKNLAAATESLKSDVTKLIQTNTFLQKKLTAATVSLRSDVTKLTQTNTLLQKKLTATTESLRSDVEILTWAVQRTFKITGYRAKKGKNTVYQSPPFYTSCKGYRMRIGVFVNGCYEGIGTHISVYVELLKGDHDDKLSWPFVGEVTVTLLNQLEDENHYSKTTRIQRENNICAEKTWDYPKFIPIHHLDHKYLKDDTLHFMVSVAPEQPWLHRINSSSFSTIARILALLANFRLPHILLVIILLILALSILALY